MSSTRILPGSSLMGTQQFDPAYQYQVGQSGQQRPMYPLNIGFHDMERNMLIHHILLILEDRHMEISHSI